MNSFFVLSLLLCISCSIADPIIGFKTTLSERGIEYLQSVGVTILEQNLQSLSIPDMSGKSSTPIGPVYYQLTNIVLTGLTIPSSNVTLSPPDSLNVNIDDVSASMTLDWYYKEDSIIHVSDHGTADVSITSTTMGVTIAVGESGGAPTATASSCSVDIGHLDIKVHGGASWLYNWFISTFSGMIKSATEGVLKQQLPTSINQGLASAIASLPLQEVISKGIGIDYELEAPPTITSSYLTLSAKGEIFDTKNPVEAPYAPGLLPDIATTEMIQMFISDYSLNSASFTLFNEKQMQYMITNSMLPKSAPVQLNTSYFVDLIPPLAKAYPDQMFELFIYATETPTTMFTPQGAFTHADGEIQFIMLPGNEVAFTLSIETLSEGSAALSGLNITGHLTFVNLTLALANSSIGQFDVSTLNQIMEALVSDGLIPEVNKLFGAGFPLPTISGLTFIDPVVGWGQNYIYVSTDATYDPSKKKEDIFAQQKMAISI